MNEFALDLENRILRSDNVKAFLRVIRRGETTQKRRAYKMIVGGGRLRDDSRHPNVVIPIKRLGVSSSAAGAYQFIFDTWKTCSTVLDLNNFGPRAQDIAAAYLIWDKFALQLVEDGKLTEAIYKVRKVWASLPGDAHKQGGISMETAFKVFKKYGGVVNE